MWARVAPLCPGQVTDPGSVTIPHLTLSVCCGLWLRMQIGMRHFSSETMACLAGAAEAGLGRYELAAELCERAGWVNAAGAPCVTSARLALPEIARRYGFRLARGVPPPRGEGLAAVSFSDVAFAGALGDLSDVRVELETSRSDHRAD